MTARLCERHSGYGEPDLQTELQRLRDLSRRPWFDFAAPPPLAGHSGAWCEAAIETFFLLRDLGALRRMVDQIPVLAPDDDGAPFAPDELDWAAPWPTSGLVFSSEHAGWLTPQEAALRTCLRRIEHACALQVLAESWT